MLRSLAILVLGLVCMSYAHLCLISPPQRGSMTGLNKPAAADCILTQSPCGGRERSSEGIILMAGENFTVTVQKNLDHFYKSDPGYFSISIGGENSTLKEIGRFVDDSSPSLTLYITNVTIPLTRGRVVLQARYVTQNPGAPAVFYQCSDINIIPFHRYKSMLEG